MDLRGQVLMDPNEYNLMLAVIVREDHCICQPWLPSDITD
jgi:hypothetical protein